MEGNNSLISCIYLIREGTSFIVSFTPIEYGKMKVGKLVVQTDEMYW
jgi:hypothetical protein